MDSNALVCKIVAAFRELEQELLQQDENQRPKGDKQWTQTVLTTLCKLGRRLGYTTWNEWLYDASWRHSDTSNRLISVPMVAESEWGNLEAIEYDFQKLLLARSAVLRVMVYDAKKADDGAERLCEHVGAFNGARGDTYLLIAFVGDISETRWFEFSEIIAQGPGNPPILQTL